MRKKCHFEIILDFFNYNFGPNLTPFGFHHQPGREIHIVADGSILAPFIAAFVRGEIPKSPRKGVTPVPMLKLVVEDLAAYYTEARTQFDKVAARGGWAGRRSSYTAGFAAFMAGDNEDAVRRLSKVMRTCLFGLFPDGDLIITRRQTSKKNQKSFFAKIIQYGVEVPRNVQHGLQLDKDNGNNLWISAIETEILALIKLDCFDFKEVFQSPDTAFASIAGLFVAAKR